MKNWTFCFLLCCSFFINKEKNHQLILNAYQNIKYSKNDSIFVNKDLPIFEISPCVKKILIAVEKSNSKHYKTGKSFYGLIFNNRKKYRYLEIFSDQWNDAKDTSYIGAIKLDQAIFLCGGNVVDNSLFHRVPGVIKVKLRKAKTPAIPMPIEPSLRGTFTICEGLPIYIEVYIADPINGYTMHVKH
jgi:hypothetical protein